MARNGKGFLFIFTTLKIFNMTSYSNYLQILLSVLLLFPGYYISGQKVNTQNQLLWKIEGNGLKKPSYLFGTMHVKDERVFNLSDSVFIGIDQTDIFAAEVDIDLTLVEMIKLLFNKDTSDFLKNKMSKENYTKLDGKIRDKLGVGLDKINSKETWLLNMFMKDYDHDKSENQRATFLDAYLYGLAKKLKKTTIGLETLNDYSRIEEDKNMEVRLNTLLKQTERSSSEDEFKQIVSMYEKGDLKVIDDFRKTFPSEFMHDVLIRNVNMTHRMDSILKTKSMFVAMGCAHLPGDSGMIDLLRRKGYTLSPVKAIYAGLEKKYRYSNVDYNWTSYVPSTGTFEVSSPGPIVDFPVPRYENLDMKMYMTPDIYRNTFFIVLNMNMGRNVTPEMEDKMLNVFADGFAQRSLQTISKKIIEENGKKKLYTLLKSNKDQYYRYMIMIQGTEVLMGAVSGDKKIVMDENSDRFLTSIKFLKDQKIQVDPDLRLYRDTLGSFEVLLPKTKLEEYRKTIEGEETFEMFMKYSNVPYKGNTFFATWYAYRNGRYVDDDSAAILAMFENIQRNPDYEIKSKKNLLFKNKYQALQIEAIHKQVTYSSILFMVNGNKIYMFMVLGESQASIANESVANFFNYIELTEFTYSNTEKFRYYPADSSYSIMMYAEPKIDSSSMGSFYNQYYDQTVTYAFNDPSSSGAYAVSYYRTSPYYTIDSPAKFLDSISVVGRDTTEEKIYNKTSYMLETNPVVEYYVRAKNGKVKRLRYYLSNDGVFELVLASLEKDLGSIHAKDFFTSFWPKHNFGSVSKDKGEWLLEDLMSEDTLKQEAARKALNIVTFNKNNIPSIKKALLFDHHDASDYYSVSAKVLDAVQRSLTKEYPSFVSDLYLQNQSNSKLQCELLTSLADMKDDSNSFYTFLNLFANHPPSENKFNAYDLNRFCYSKYAEDLIEPYLEKMKDKTFRSSIVNSMGGLSDTSVTILRIMAEKYAVMETFMTQYIMPAYRRGDTIEMYYEYMLIHLIDLFPKEKKNIWYSEFIKSKDKSLVYETMVLMIKNDLSVEPAIVNKYASDIHYQYYLYKELRELNKLDVYPKDKLTSKNIAMASMVSYMEEDDGSVSKVSIIGEREIILNNVKRMAYLIKGKWDGGKEWYVGISAPGDLKATDSTTEELYKFTYSEFELLSAKSVEVHFDTLIKKLRDAYNEQ
jgi:uncharacterized protein YbaP (TraB family)